MSASVKSMTGYGRGEHIAEERKLTVEMKSVNHRYNDITIKLPRSLASLEDKIKKRIMREVFRGKTDVYISFETFSAADVEVKLNEALAAAYIEKLKLIEEKFGIYSENKLELAAKFPDVITVEKAQLEEDKRQLDALAAEAEKTRQEIAKKKAEQQKVLDAAKSNKAAAAQMEQDLNAQLASVRNLIQQRLAAAEAARQAAQQQAASDDEGGGGSDDNYVQGTGAMGWPCSGPITSPFGYRTHPIFGTTIFHAGIDIGVDYGTPIHAADSGVVVYSGWISGYGNAVIIDHGGGISTLYGHNQSLAVSEGQSVSKGSVIAYAGSTGNSTGPHCHFEVRTPTASYNDCVDPEIY